MKKIYPTLTLLACIFSTHSFSQCTTPTTVPYYESFTGLTANNQLPACWAISNPTTCVTYFSGTGSAGFLDGPVGTSYFYSRAVNLNAGVTYSTSLWHKVSSASSNSWSDLSILLGTSQSSSALVSLATVNFPASPVYVALSNTFVVASSGTYYFAIRGISINNSFSDPSLTWDDFEVTIPCTLAGNAPSLTVVASATSLCTGETVTVTASGAKEAGNSELKFIEVVDLRGRIIFATQTTNEKLKIDLKEFSAGIYYARINSAGKTETLKLIKE